jgi:hypothetical protein
MSAAHYRLLAALAASLSLATAACGLEPVGWSEQPNAANTQQEQPNPGNTQQEQPNPGNTQREQPNAANTQQEQPNPGNTPQEEPNAANTQQASTAEPSEIDTESSIWTILGLAKKEGQHDPGPQTGSTVSPILYQAALDTLSFVKFTSEDPLGGSLVTDWYSPPDKPNERYRINVFILSRALHSDSLAVTVTRQALLADGKWLETTVARKVETDLENAILERAGQLKRQWMRELQSEK